MEIIKPCKLCFIHGLLCAVVFAAKLSYGVNGMQNDLHGNVLSSIRETQKLLDKSMQHLTDFAKDRAWENLKINKGSQWKTDGQNENLYEEDFDDHPGESVRTTSFASSHFSKAGDEEPEIITRSGGFHSHGKCKTVTEKSSGSVSTKTTCS